MRQALMLGIALVGAALVAVAAEPTTQPAAASTTSPVSLEIQRQMRRAEVGMGLSTWPTTLPMSKIVRLELEEGRLLATPLLDTRGEEVRLNLADRPMDVCTMRVHQQPGDAGGVFQLFRYNFSQPGVVCLHATVMAHPGQVQVIGAWEYPDRERSVELIEQLPSVDEEGNRVPGGIDLRVQHIAEEDTASVHIRAGSLPQMQREHPSEINAYVRPVLRELDAEHLLAVDTGIAWQVFAAEAKADEKVTEQVKKLLAGLDSASFAEREQSAEQIRKLGQPGVLALSRIDRGGLTQEQAAVVQEIIAAVNQLPAEEAQALAQQPGFLLDCMGSDDRQLRELAGKRLAALVGRPIEFDPAGEAGRRLGQLDQLRGQLLKAPATQGTVRQ